MCKIVLGVCLLMAILSLSLFAEGNAAYAKDELNTSENISEFKVSPKEGRFMHREMSCKFYGI